MEKSENQRSVSFKNKNFQRTNLSTLKSEKLSKKIPAIISSSTKYQLPKLAVNNDRVIYLKSRSQSNISDQKLKEYEKYLQAIDQFNQKLSLTLKDKVFKNFPLSINLIQNNTQYLTNFQTILSNSNKEMQVKQSKKLNLSIEFEQKNKEKGNEIQNEILLPKIEVTKDYLDNKVNKETTQEKESTDDENINTYVKKNFTIVPDLTVPLNIKCQTLEKRNKLLEGFFVNPEYKGLESIQRIKEKIESISINKPNPNVILGKTLNGNKPFSYYLFTPKNLLDQKYENMMLAKTIYQSNKKFSPHKLSKDKFNKIIEENNNNNLEINQKNEYDTEVQFNNTLGKMNELLSARLKCTQATFNINSNLKKQKLKKVFERKKLIKPRPKNKRENKNNESSENSLSRKKVKNDIEFRLTYQTMLDKIEGHRNKVSKNCKIFTGEEYNSSVKFVSPNSSNNRNIIERSKTNKKKPDFRNTKTEGEFAEKERLIKLKIKKMLDIGENEDIFLFYFLKAKLHLFSILEKKTEVFGTPKYCFPLSGFATILINQSIFIGGGGGTNSIQGNQKDQIIHFSYLYLFDIRLMQKNKENFAIRKNMLINKSFHSFFQISNDCFISAGGCNEIYLTNCEKYSIQNNSWKEFSQLNLPVVDTAFLKIKNYLFNFGGFRIENGQSVPQKCLFRLDLSTIDSRWELIYTFHNDLFKGLTYISTVKISENKWISFHFFEKEKEFKCYRFDSYESKFVEISRQSYEKVEAKPFIKYSGKNLFMIIPRKTIAINEASLQNKWKISDWGTFSCTVE